MPKLVAETGEFAGAEYPLGAKPLVLGRLKSNDIEVRDTKASRKHTRVGRAGGVWVVEDLKSSNGTFVNGEKIEARVELHPGDTIAIGKTVYRFDPGDAPIQSPAARPSKTAGHDSGQDSKPTRVTKSKPAPRPAPAPVVDEPDELDVIDATMEPQELSLEEPEELGLDGGEAPAAPAAPAAPKAPAAPRPQVRGQALVSINSVQKASRTGLLGEDIGQRGPLFQAITYVVGIAVFVAIVYGAYALAVGALGDGPEEVPIDETAPAEPGDAGDGGG